MKDFWKSKGFWGAVIALLGFSGVPSEFIPAPEAILAYIDQTVELVGIVLGLYGRWKADKPLTLKS